jgi:hypothetical protein
MDPAATTMTDGVFRTAPASAFPPSAPPVIYVEADGRPRWVIREDADLADVVAELDRIGTHLVRHGLWAPQDGGDRKPPPSLRHAS